MMTMKCGMRTAFCVCERTDDHEEHVCGCGGSWKGTQSGEITEVLAFPGGRPATLGGLFAEIWEILGRYDDEQAEGR